MTRLLTIITILISITSLAQSKKSLLRDGNKLFADSSYNQAEIQYRKSLEKDQDYFNASFNLADAIYKQERYNESSALFNALKDNASNETNLANLYHNLGNSLVKEKKIDQAIEAYKSALRINPNDQETRHNLALTQKQKNNKENQEKEDSKENQQEKEDSKENQQEKEDSKENQQEKEGSKENQQEKEEMSKETAKKMLEAIEQKEKDLQIELQKKKTKGKRANVLKDW